LNNGNIVLSGTHSPQSDFTNYTASYVIFNDVGDILSNRRVFKGNLFSSSLTTDGGFVMAGTFAVSRDEYFPAETTVNGSPVLISSEVYPRGLLVVKCNQNGLVEWITSLPFISTHLLTTSALCPTADGGFILTGERMGTPAAPFIIPSNLTVSGEQIQLVHHDRSTQGLMIKFNNIGKVSWAASIGGYSQFCSVSSITPHQDGSFIITGGYDRYIMGKVNIVKTNNGEVPRLTEIEVFNEKE
jgi:hypothetical protein